MIKERPILFSAPMVLAILEGRKTQTRRVVKPQPVLSGPPIDSSRKHWIVDYGQSDKSKDSAWPEGESPFLTYHPYGVPGDRLWVREMLQTGAKNNPKPSLNHCWRYVADNEPVLVDPRNETDMRVWAHHKEGDICVSIHMPRWASRITLEITDVRVHRLQEISEDDGIAEGAEAMATHGMWREGRREPYMSCQKGFRTLWDSINGKTHPWVSNPWIWALTFTVLGK